jgi:hypothetical protein
MKRVILVILVILAIGIGVLFQTRTQRTLVRISPNATRKVIIEGRPVVFALEMWLLKIRLIDMESGKTIAKERLEVRDVFLDWFIGGTHTENYPIGTEWLTNGSVNIVISDRGSVIQLPSGKHFDIWSAEYLEESQENQL